MSLSISVFSEELRHVTWKSQTARGRSQVFRSLLSPTRDEEVGASHLGPKSFSFSGQSRLSLLADGDLGTRKRWLWRRDLIGCNFELRFSFPSRKYHWLICTAKTAGLQQVKTFRKFYTGLRTGVLVKSFITKHMYSKTRWVIITTLYVDATIVVSKNCPIIGEHVIIFVTQ